MSDTYDLILAAYASLDAAQKDFDALVALVKDKKVRSDGMIMVRRDEAGEVHVTDTGNHLGRKAPVGAEALACLSAWPRRPCSAPSRWARPRAASPASS